jgi:transposase
MKDSQLGPNVHALLTIVNKELGLSHGKSVRLLRTLFPELRLARGTGVRSTPRTAARCAPAYEQVRKKLAWCVGSRAR